MLYNPPNMDLTRAQYLGALGIDVYVRRELVGAVARGPETETTAETLTDMAVPHPSAAPGVAEPSAPANRGARKDLAPEQGATQTVEFSVRCVRYGRAFVLIDSTLWHERRLVGDLALALNGFESAKRTAMRFDWPQPRIGDPNQGIAQARKAFRAFFLGQVSAEDRTLGIGKGIATLLEADDSTPVSAGEAHGVSMIFIESLRRDAAFKKSIWQAILTTR